MASADDKQYYAELSRHTLRAVRAAGVVIEFCRECPLDQIPAVDDLFVSLGAGARVPAITAVAPQSMHWHRADPDEAARYRGETDLSAFAAGLPHGCAPPHELIACDAGGGSRVAAAGKAPWLLGVTPAAALENEIAAARKLGIAPSRVESITTAHLGTVSTALRSTKEGRVLLWDLGDECSQVFLVSADGVDAVQPCAAGMDAVFGAVQTALGLKLRGAASRLFFNADLDLSDVAPKISTVLKPALQAAVDALRLTNSKPAFAVIGLMNHQGWFAREMARAVGLAPWEPGVADVVGQLSLELAPGVTVSRGSLGLLHQVAAHARQSTAWLPAWTQREMAAGLPPAAVAAPVAASPAPAAPATAVLAASAAPAVAVVGEPLGNTAAPNGASGAPLVSRTTESIVTPPSTPSRRVEPPPVPAKADSTGPGAYVPPRRRGYGLYIGLAAGVVCAAIAAKFYFEMEAAKDLVERERAGTASLVESTEASSRELEQRVQAEAMRIRQEEEVVREAAVALARKEAEEQTRRQMEAEFQAKRIATLPGILIVTTSPAGAEVSIDGGARGRTPLALNDIPPGSRHVAITLAGFEPVEHAVEIKGEQATDLGMINLQRAIGTLLVSSVPDGMEFTLGRAGVIGAVLRSGRTPARIDELEPGEYRVTFSRPGWPDVDETVTVARRETVKAAGKFVGGALTLTSVPSGATVTRDGQVLGTTPLDLPDCPPQMVNWEVALPGYEPATVTGEVKPGQHVRLDAVLLSVDRIAQASEVKVLPQPYETPAPRLGNLGSNGPRQVNVSFTVMRDGTLRDVTATGTPDKELARRCVEAVSKWKFHPGLGHDDRPLNMRVTLPIRISTDG